MVSHRSPLVVVMAPHGEHPDPARVWTSVLAVLCVPGGRTRAPTRRTGGSGPKINKRSSRTPVQVHGVRAGTRVTPYEPAGEGRSGTNLLGPTAAHDHRPRTPRRERRVHRGIIFVMGAHDRPAARQRTGMRPRSAREVKGSSKISSRPDAQLSGWIQRRGRSRAAPEGRITSGPGGETPGYRSAP